MTLSQAFLSSPSLGRALSSCWTYSHRGSRFQHWESLIVPGIFCSNEIYFPQFGVSFYSLVQVELFCGNSCPSSIITALVFWISAANDHYDLLSTDLGTDSSHLRFLVASRHSFFPPFLQWTSNESLTFVVQPHYDCLNFRPFCWTALWRVDQLRTPRKDTWFQSGKLLCLQL